MRVWPQWVRICSAEVLSDAAPALVESVAAAEASHGDKAS
jgi:hypothetical protein